MTFMNRPTRVLSGLERCIAANSRPRSTRLHCRAWPCRNTQHRTLHASSPGSGQSRGKLQEVESLKEYEKYFRYPKASGLKGLQVGDVATVHGFLSKKRQQHATLMFVDLVVPSGPRIQIQSAWQEEGSAEHARHLALKDVTVGSSVSVTGEIVKVQTRQGKEGLSNDHLSNAAARVDLALHSIQVLNPFPKDIIVSKKVQFPPSARHLQIRFSQALQNRLDFRDYVNQRSRAILRKLNFREYETPILFKSTPEGAREFLVPTRKPGKAYALPQSPQQFKQLLMASGLGNYYQFARCFRDEDQRADRQPEFTQLDLEMPFATGVGVMQTVESAVRSIYDDIRQEWVFSSDGQETSPWRRGTTGTAETREYPEIDPVFRHFSYNEAMSKYGSDKPDLRIPNEIHRIDHLVPASFTSMITSLEGPIVEVIRFRFDARPGDLKGFVDNMMNALPLPAKQNTDGAPAMLIFDSSKPLGGLSSLGHDGVAALTGTGSYFADMEEGDLLVIQARANKPLTGGGTVLGVLRSALYEEAVAAKLLPQDHSLHFAWVTGFPMFTVNDGVDPGQGGEAGFQSTHHPFTAPLTPEDFELLASDPLQARADHYDLVLNGVELGGGSRRIHVAAVQEYVMREILQMPEERIGQFAHLLSALRAGCPPHAGFALGFDRLVAVLSGTKSVRDVIAFPKSKKGDDAMVGSPSAMTEAQLKTYNLSLRRA